MAGLDNVSAISAWGDHTCALRDDGGVSCWGSTEQYEPVHGESATRTVPTPEPVPQLDSATAIAVGQNHACALLDSGPVVCWGSSFLGSLGDGSTGGFATTPVEVAGLDDADVIAAGGWSSCAVLKGGSVVCWGVGVGTGVGGEPLVDSSVPMEVPGLEDVVGLGVGSRFYCALDVAGSVICSGPNDPNVVTGLEVTSETLHAISDLTAASIAIGGSHVCAIRTDGDIACWGANWYDQLGNGGLSYVVATPHEIAGIGNLTQISMGGTHTCGVSEKSSVLCRGVWIWGLDQDNALPPTEVPDLTDATTTASSFSGACAVREGGEPP